MVDDGDEEPLFQFVLIAGGKHEFAGFFLGIRVAAEERAEIALEPG